MEDTVPNCCEILSPLRPSLRIISSEISGFFITGGGCFLLACFLWSASYGTGGGGGGGDGGVVARSDEALSTVSSFVSST